MAEFPSIDKKHDSSVPRCHINGQRSLQFTQKKGIFCAEMLSNTKEKNLLPATCQYNLIVDIMIACNLVTCTWVNQHPDTGTMIKTKPKIDLNCF